MLIDLHVYTRATGGPSLKDAVAQAREAGLDAIAVVDRRSSREVATLVAAGETDGFPVFVGVEIPTEVGDVLVFVPEIEPFMTREEWRQLDVVQPPTFSDVREMVEREGGVLLMAHPYDRRRERAPRDRVFALERVAALEIWTSGADRASNAAAYEAVTAARVPGFAGSAAAGRKPAPSQWATLLRAPVATHAELVAALRAGDLWPVEFATGEPGSERQGGGGGRREDRGPREDRGRREDRGPREDRGRRDDRRGGRSSRG